MLTDAAALAFALFAATMAARPASGRWTFGYSRLEILAAQANGITLGLLGAVGDLVGCPPAPRPQRRSRWHGARRRARRSRRQPRRKPCPCAREPREPERSRRVPSHRHGRGGVRRDGGGRRADPCHGLGSVRPDREPRGGGVDALVERRAAARVDGDLPRAGSARHRTPTRSATRWSPSPRWSRCTTYTSGRSRAAFRRSLRTSSWRRMRTATRCGAGSSDARASASASRTRRCRSTTPSRASVAARIAEARRTPVERR